ncbi:hypothetical protein MKZ38_000389 [Zalerion maritima]|uniref:PH domain-containing protein n=1 Tax=Zalerion maritima TaxID=339359 RepID=A0AAD5RRJ4_9PEZI|nr:hypothetical protein MKZ38_000389 [Zalerion maritima]
MSQFSGNWDARIHGSHSSSPQGPGSNVKQDSSDSFTSPSPAPSANQINLTRQQQEQEQLQHFQQQQQQQQQSQPQPIAVAAATAAASSHSSASTNGSRQVQSSPPPPPHRSLPQRQAQQQQVQQQTPVLERQEKPGPLSHDSRSDPIREGEAYYTSPDSGSQSSPKKQLPPIPPPHQQGISEEEREEQRDEIGDEEYQRSSPRSRRQSTYASNEGGGSPSRRVSGRQSRPLSMIQTYHPPLMDVNADTIPELLPIFTFLNSHANKLYNEGYFVKLDDQNTQGRTNPDRTWTECFAQLVGTVLSLWDAQELDIAGEEGVVLPKFVNLTDASIQMIASLPTTSGSNDQPLQNILSISTAGRNRYLLHFNSHHSLLQWTASIRLSMYEQATLQEAYTGALIAGKGKTLNNINLIMERARHPVESWVRVRFGAGTPWRRCYCVIRPPEEKEYQKAHKEWKKKSPYDRSGPPPLKGEMRFYDTKLSPKKQKKATPLATITDSYSAYAIYPQTKSLIDASTLVKIEGRITYFLEPPSDKEGFVFVMPEVPPAVSGFEMLLRFLFPTWDTFHLYGRPGRLVASILDQRSLMFAMPKHKKYGYLEVLDVTGLLLSDGSEGWTERDWRKKMKELTSTRMATVDDASSAKTHSRSGSRRSNRLSIGPSGSTGSTKPRVNFADDSIGAVRSGRSMTVSQAGARTDSAPPTNRGYGHSRNSSDPHGVPMPHNPLGYAAEFSPSQSPARGGTPPPGFRKDLASTPEGQSSDEELPRSQSPVLLQENVRDLNTPEPVTAPPAFSHSLTRKPTGKAYHSPELRKANARLSHTTLSQMMTPGTDPISDPMNDARINQDQNARWDSEDSPVSSSGYSGRHAPVVHPHTNPVGTMANVNGSREALNPPAQRGAGRPRSPLAQATGSQYGAEIRRAPQPPASAFANDSRYMQSVHSNPSSRSNSMGSQKHHAAFHRPFTPPVPSSSQPPMSNVQTSDPNPTVPLPERTASLRSGASDNTPQSASSVTSSFADLAIDPAALDKVHPTEPRMHGLSRRDTERSGASSNYDDASTTSPDYASTVQSDGTAESMERPRAGVLRTVGDVNHQQATGNANKIPEINFGPTYNMAVAGGRGVHNESPPQGSVGQGGLVPYSLGQKTPTPPGDYGHNRQASNETVRQVAWQAGSASAGTGTPSRGLSPEEFVQQRATQPAVLHQRQASGNTLRGGSPTPPLNRSATYDQVPKQVHSRNSSADLLQRPASRGANSALNVGSGLSAREQEHVAKMTGSSLLQVDHRRPEPQSAGLVGAIAQREREKMQLKQGLNNQAVHQAIHQRQQQAYQQQMHQQLQQQQMLQQFQQQQRQQQQQQPMYQQPTYGMSNASSPSVYTGMAQQSQPRQPYSGQPSQVGAQACAQGGGWSRSNVSQGAGRGVAPPQRGVTTNGQRNQGGRGHSPGPQFEGQAF